MRTVNGFIKENSYSRSLVPEPWAKVNVFFIKVTFVICLETATTTTKPITNVQCAAENSFKQIGSEPSRWWNTKWDDTEIATWFWRLWGLLESHQQLSAHIQQPKDLDLRSSKNGFSCRAKRADPDTIWRGRQVAGLGSLEAWAAKDAAAFSGKGLFPQLTFLWLILWGPHGGVPLGWVRSNQVNSLGWFPTYILKPQGQHS